VNGDLVGETEKLKWKTLDARDQERGVLETRSLGSPRAAHEGIRARVDGDREGVRLGLRAIEDIATVTRSDVYDDVPVCGG
jgi:hypothetical protein